VQVVHSAKQTWAARSLAIFPRDLHRFHRLAGVTLLVALGLAMTSKNACAQLRGLGGGGGGVGGIGGAAVPGIGGGGGGMPGGDRKSVV